MNKYGPHSIICEICVTKNHCTESRVKVSQISQMNTDFSLSVEKVVY